MSVPNHNTWKFFKEFQNRWNLSNCIVLTTKSIDPAQSFEGRSFLTMGGTGYQPHKNITNIVIPKNTIGYFEKADSGINGTLVKFAKYLSMEEVDKKPIPFTIRLIEQNPNHIAIMLSPKDMECLQILCHK
jgi:hypothetical protein